MCVCVVAHGAQTLRLEAGPGAGPCLSVRPYAPRRALPDVANTAVDDDDDDSLADDDVANIVSFRCP